MSDEDQKNSRPEFCGGDKPLAGCRLFMLEELEEKLGGLASRQDKRLSALEMRMNAGELSVMEIKTEFKNLKDFIRESQKKSLQITIAAIMGGFAIAGAVIGVIFK